MGLFGERLRKIYDLSPEKLREWDKRKRVSDVKRDTDKIEGWQAAAYTLNRREINELFDDLTYEVHKTGKAISEHKTTRLSPLSDYRAAVNPQLRGVLKNYQTMSLSAATNDHYKNTIRHYVHRLTMDDSELNAPMAIRKAIREMTEQGINTVTFKSGRTMRMDSAVRMSIMGEFTQITQQVQQKLSDETDAGGWEITAHAFPAKDHADVQGMVFTDEEFEKLQNHEPATDIDGNVHHLEHRNIGEYNCGHQAMVFFIGISERAYSQEYLDRIQGENEVGVQWQGERVSLYEGTQIQRRIENELRNEKERLNALKEVRGNDPRLEHDYQKSRARLAELRDEYKALGAKLEPHAIRMKPERASVPRGSTGNATVPNYQSPPKVKPITYNPVSDELKDKMQGQSNITFNNLTPGQTTAIKDYSDESPGKIDYNKINPALYDTKSMIPEIQERVNEIDSIMKHVEVSNNLITYKGTEAKWYDDWKVGEIHDIKAFFSTSISKDVVLEDFSEFTNSLLIEIQVPKGTNGLYLGTNSECDWEEELLLNRGIKYKVLEKTDKFMKLEIQR